MDELKNLTDQTCTLQITNALQRLCKIIQKQKIDEKTSESSIKEIEFLKEQCESSNVQLSLLACQTFVHLVEDGVLQAARVLTIFISMLTTASGIQITAISEGIINLLLIDLKHRASQKTKYKCPFGLKPPQHPIILILQKTETNVVDITMKIDAICNHHDESIRDNSFEFLRPVFLYALCNPNVIADVKPIWLCVLNRTLTSPSAMYLLQQIFTWNRYCSNVTCLNISIMLNETIVFMLNAKRFSIALDMQFNQVALLSDLVKMGYDPRPALNVLRRTLSEVHQEKSETTLEFYNFVLIALAELLHTVSPVYLMDVLSVLQLLIETQHYGNPIILNMILDGLIVRKANANRFLSTDFHIIADKLITLISSSEKQHHSRNHSLSTPNYNYSKTTTIKYRHPHAAILFNMAICSEYLLLRNADDEISHPNLSKFLLQLEKTDGFEINVQILLRSLLLCSTDVVTHQHWLKIWSIIIKVVKTNVTISIDMIFFTLYLLAKETNGEKQLALMRGLAEFAYVKENIPIILNTYRAVSTSAMPPLQILCFDLYVRLWKNENRTYQFLHKLLLNDLNITNQNSKWELNIAKANAIKEICQLKPSQHGKDLVVFLSDILNSCSDDKNDLATSLSLDSIVLLCNSHTVNIASTWKALGGKFINEKRPRSMKSLCKFFSEVPLLKSPTPEYEQLFCDAINQLWTYITDYDAVDIIVPALKALKNFNITELTLKHMPVIYREDLRIPKEFQATIAASPVDEAGNHTLTVVDVFTYIPGECWIQLLEKINGCAVDSAVDLIHHYIECEVNQFRSGIYMLTGGRTEPNELVQLHARSPLRALTKYVRQQAQLSRPDNVMAFINCLKCLTRKFSKPIPPFDWFFLLDTLDKRFDDEEFPYQLRKYSLAIAANQIAHSGSAKNLLENYLQEFRATNCYNEEILCVVQLIPSISNGISSDILQRFLTDITDFAYEQSKSTDFKNTVFLEQILNSLTPIYNEKCLIQENVDVITGILSKFYDVVDVNSKFFLAYTKVLTVLPVNELQTLTDPETWTVDNFQKAAIVRCTVCKHSKNPDHNQLLWLNLVIDHAIDNNQQTYVMTQIFIILTSKYHSERHVCEWLMYLLGKIQSVLTVEDTFGKMSQAPFLLDIFFMIIMVSSGYSIYSNSAPPLRAHTIELFPEALECITRRKYWMDNIVRVFEFLHHLLSTDGIFSTEVYTAVRDALICCKNHEYYFQKNNWTKYIELQLKR